ncbi:MAG: Crp/Fnr family transcriptional regulator [Hyphomicrobiaceae bacterium]
MTASTESWVAAFPGLGALGPEVRQALETAGRVVRIAAGERIFGPGQTPQNYLLLIDGSIRVQQVAESGREIVLYRVATGQSCALTTACLMGYEDYPAEAIAETDCTAVAIPRATFDDLIARSPEFRRFVFTAFSVRVTGLLRLLDEVAFQRLDIRLAARLLALAGDHDRLTITHQQLAAELGTAREVVTRLLQELQRRNWIAAGRGHIDILDRPALQRIAADH